MKRFDPVTDPASIARDVNQEFAVVARRGIPRVGPRAIYIGAKDVEALDEMERVLTLEL